MRDFAEIEGRNPPIIACRVSKALPVWSRGSPSLQGSANRTTRLFDWLLGRCVFAVCGQAGAASVHCSWP